jgi:chloramphenicol O-acetyltransferase type A
MKEVNPNDTSRGKAFSMWKNAPQPMVTFFKTFDVSKVVKLSKRSGMKLNMFLCWCMGRSARDIREFYYLPIGDSLYEYDKLALNVVVKTHDGSISLCDIPYSDDIREFNADYLRITNMVYKTNENYELGDDYNIISTSSIPTCDIDGAVNMYSGKYNNPFLVWGKYRSGFFKKTLPISFQFHHVQMDGGDAANYLNTLQKVMNNINY